MSIEAPGPFGAASLVWLADLPPLERRVVVCARLWRVGPSGRAELERGLILRHGPSVGLAAAGRLGEVLDIVETHSRSRIRIGPVGSEGAAGDECVLARLVTLAADGAREEAILIATLLIHADMALELTRLSRALGHLVLRRSGALTLIRD